MSVVFGPPMQNTANNLQGCVTRAELDCPILGKPTELQKNVLPCELDVLRYWQFLKASVEKPGIIPKRHNLTAKVAADIVEIWASASISSITVWSVTMRIDKLIESYLKLIKSAKRDADKDGYKMKLMRFKDDLSSLFDICSCKCKDFNNCRCVKDKKVPKIEHAFLKDQCQT